MLDQLAMMLSVLQDGCGSSKCDLVWVWQYALACTPDIFGPSRLFAVSADLWAPMGVAGIADATLFQW
eukprot:3678961-Amphidinium_carterae.2